MPALQELYQQKLKDLGVEIVGVTQFNTTKGDAEQFVSEHGLTFNNIFDEEAGIARRYDVQGVPHYVYIDRQGRIARQTAGARGVQVINSILEQLVAEPAG